MGQHQKRELWRVDTTVKHQFGKHIDLASMIFFVYAVGPAQAELFAEEILAAGKCTVREVRRELV